MKPEPIVPAALVEKCGPNTAGTETDRGTGEREPHARSETADELERIRDCVETDFVTSLESVRGPLATELMQARMDRRALLDLIDKGAGRG